MFLSQCLTEPKHHTNLVRLISRSKSKSALNFPMISHKWQWTLKLSTIVEEPLIDRDKHLSNRRSYISKAAFHRGGARNSPLEGLWFPTTGLLHSDRTTHP